MVTAIIYLIDSIIIGVFSYKCYSIGYGKKLKNPFANYLFLSTFFLTLSFLSGFFLTFIAAFTSDDSFIFSYNILARILFYISAVFSVQIPLYKLYPNDKRRYIFSFLAGIVGIALLAYQYSTLNSALQPIINSVGIVSWNADIVLIVGMMYLMILPWAATSIIFINEFIRSRFSKPKLLFLGFGFFLICVGTSFQDVFSIVSWYVLFSIIAMMGFLLTLAGMFYEEE
jgi:hypothetical protein